MQSVIDSLSSAPFNESRKIRKTMHKDSLVSIWAGVGRRLRDEGDLRRMDIRRRTG